MKEYQNLKYLGNYRHWLKDEWIEYVTNNQGSPQPQFEFVENDILGAIERGERSEFCEYQKKYASAGYDLESTLYYVFDSSNLPFADEIGIPPWVTDYKEGTGTYFNLFKYGPGHILPIHSDKVTKFEKNCRRYWMPWKDYEEGHIFLYEDQLVAPYKAGDVFEFVNSFATHGAANIGLTTRITFQFTTYDYQ